MELAEESVRENALLSDELVLLDVVDELVLPDVGPNPLGMPFLLGGPRLMISSAAILTLSCLPSVAFALGAAAAACEAPGPGPGPGTGGACLPFCVGGWGSPRLTVPEREPMLDVLALPPERLLSIEEDRDDAAWAPLYVAGGAAVVWATGGGICALLGKGTAADACAGGAGAGAGGCWK